MSRMPESGRPAAPPAGYDQHRPARPDIVGYVDPPESEPPEPWPGSPAEPPLPAV